MKYSKLHYEIELPTLPSIEAHNLPAGDTGAHSSAAIEDEQTRQRNSGRGTERTVQIGLLISIFFGVACITLGTLMRTHRLPVQPTRYSNGNLRLTLNPPYIREIILLLLNLTFVKLSVRSAGIAHEMALKWKLAFEDDKRTGKVRLEFNSNLRFLQSSYDWKSANGLPANVIMALCLTISYAASSMVLLGMEQENSNYNVILSFVALYVLGTSILVQSSIAFYAILTTEIPTWSQSPLVTANVLVQEGRLVRRPGRCMHALFDVDRDGPLRPRRFQESVWDSYPQFRQFTIYIWMVVATGYYWAFIIWAMMDSGTQGAHPGDNWSLIPSSASNSSSPIPMGKDTGLMNFNWQGEAPTVGILWGLGILVGFQGGMITTALTCSESIAQAVSDERLWREAGTAKGSDPSPGPWKTMFISPYTTSIHISDPVLHWGFGLAVGVNADVGFQIRPVQILYVSLIATIGVAHLTWTGKRRFLDRQPSTYGHLQTLVDLIDEWHVKMYWGHKGGGHAGTSYKPLQLVNMEEEYGFKDRPNC